MQAGTSKSQLKPIVGGDLMGYGNRNSGSTGIHDLIYVRAVALEQDGITIVLCSIDICFLRPPDVRAIQQYVTDHSDLTVDQLIISCTHTHSAPAASDRSAWETPFVEAVGACIFQAYENRQPAKIGIGAGLLYGYSINRRWLDRPIDPGVSVIRIDTLDDQPLAVIGNFACHAVVMGYDNLLISGDWPGHASRMLEAEFGEPFVAITTQGGAGDVNPLTEAVRSKLDDGHPVTSIGEISTYYGSPDAETSWNIGDRAGGTFAECEVIAQAYTAELKKVWQRIRMSTDLSMWVTQMDIDATLSDQEPEPVELPPVLKTFLPDMSQETLQLQCTVIGIGDSVIYTQPGEAFSETSVALRKTAQQMGYRHAFLMTYTNGSYGYLPPENAFSEGGYEVLWPLGLGISRYFQDRYHDALRTIFNAHKAQ